jgi:hypothetical protein
VYYNCKKIFEEYFLVVQTLLMSLQDTAYVFEPLGVHSFPKCEEIFHLKESEEECGDLE